MSNSIHQHASYNQDITSPWERDMIAHNRQLIEIRALNDMNLGHYQVIDYLREIAVRYGNRAADHSDHIDGLAVRLGRKLLLSDEMLQQLELLAEFHDIGKILIPDSILNKPAALSSEEWAIVKQHPRYGYLIAKSVSVLQPIANSILCHHEWWDGSGYPLGLVGKEIPLLSRITAVIDAFDAMVVGRAYKPPISSSEALQELNRWTERQFDPHIVAVFSQLLNMQGGMSNP